MSLGLRTFAPVGCDTDGIVAKSSRPTIGCDTDGIVAKSPRPTIGCDTDGIVGNISESTTESKGNSITDKLSDRLQKAYVALAAARLAKSSFTPMISHDAYTTPDFGFGPGVTPGATGMWAVPPMTTPGVPGGIMM